MADFKPLRRLPDGKLSADEISGASERSQVIRDILLLAALLLVGVLILIAVWGVIVRHAKEHGHNLTGTHASVPGMQRGEAGRLREANDGGGVHGFIDARASLSTPLNGIDLC